MSKISLAISTCPNDTFSFYAFLHKKIKTNLQLEYQLHDITKLNELLLNKSIDVCKGSIAIYPLIEENYCILKSGVTISYGCGPILVTKLEKTNIPLESAKIAIPGFTTTAYKLLKLYNNSILDHNLVQLLFSEIPTAVKDGEVDYGLIIHETRFTYENYGLIKYLDLGEWWEKEYNLPIPLGCIYARKDLGIGLINIITQSIKESILYARENYEETLTFIKMHAKELDDHVIKEHILLFVTDSSIHAGDQEELAIKTLLKLPKEKTVFCEVN